MSKKRILCKFFSHGACLKGEFCEFSHDWKPPAKNICTFYQKGACFYGNRCRYEHVKVSHSVPSDSSQCMCLGSISCCDRISSFPDTGFASNGFLMAPEKSVWTKTLASQSSDVSSDVPICSFAAAGNCPRGQNCPHLHGDLCSICGKHCLHPYRHQERDEHVKTCKKREKHLEAIKYSQEVECSVCLERVLSKPTASERKFGVLSECDHPFCVSCIRNWRSNSPSYGMDVNSTLRACPICRKLSYFVIPSVIWYSTKEEKVEIIEGYRAKLRSIDCKHFDYGNGTCPFGTSCFYKHAYLDGRLEEVVIRHLGAEDGHTLIAKDIRLSEFLSNLLLR